mgnify:CR=1 FL=1
MKVNINWMKLVIKEMVKELYIMIVEIKNIMKVNGKMVKRMEKGHIIILLATHIRVNGKIIKRMDKELKFGIVEINTWVNTKMIRYTKALKLISENVIKSKTLETIKTDNSNNRILGRDYYSKLNIPKTERLRNFDAFYYATLIA